MRVRIATTLGQYQSDPLPIEAGVTEEAVNEAVVELLQEFTKLTYLSIEIDGVTRYFNPANVVWVEIV